MEKKESWQIRIDTGGTFTDCWAADPVGRVRTVKVLSSGRLRLEVVGGGGVEVNVRLPETWTAPDDFFVGYRAVNHRGDSCEVLGFDAATGRLELAAELETETWIELSADEEAPVVGARLLTGTALGEAFPPLDFRLATTRGTNALLERKGAPLVLFSNVGFGDLLEIGDQRRPDLFALCHEKRQLLHRRAIEVDGRMDCDGEEIQPLDLNCLELRCQVDAALKAGVNTAAVAFLHAYRNPEHEVAMRDYLLDAGFDHVSISSDLAPLVKLLPRTETAVTNAYLYPVLNDFLRSIESAVGDEQSIYTMTSAGGLEPIASFRPKDSLLSGPAGGVAGAAATAKDVGIDRILTFDMGGTSTDVARYAGDFIYQFQQRVGDANLLSTALKIETVAAGGGSICQWTEAGLRVGPESAGADPGPACYGRGGPLTITDVNLLLGRIDPSNFGIPLGASQIAAAERAAIELQRAAGIKSEGVDTQFLGGLLELAVEQMADAIRTISIRDGADPSEYALLAFGGAGPLHACAIAEKLDIEKIVIPAEAGILSAYGLHRSVVERIAEVQVVDQSQRGECLQRVAAMAEARLAESGEQCHRVRFLAEARLVGQDASLTIDFAALDEIDGLFARKYHDVFGYPIPSDRQVEIVTMRAVASTEPAMVEVVEQGAQTVAVSVDGQFIDRGQLPAGAEIAQPCTIQDPFSTLYLSSGWTARVLGNGCLLVERAGVPPSVGSSTGVSAQVGRELFRHRLEHIVAEMGAMLERSAISTNVKERLDFSCALLDADGRLLVGANHIPVHIGALGVCVRSVAERLPMRPGDTVITNHPGVGGSHLPDVTLITPVFSGETLVAYLANRAHHAELGGVSPGSMPPSASCLAEEGVVIDPQYLVAEGVSRFEQIGELLATAVYPTRRVADNLADLHAQLAANRRGADLVGQLVGQSGVAAVKRQMAELVEISAKALVSSIQAVEHCSSSQTLDDGAEIRVSIQNSIGYNSDSIGYNRLTIDFTGTSATHPGNFNATPAIVRSAVLYVLRLWSQSELPLNEGFLENVDIVLPLCFLNPDFPTDPRDCPAVVGGNVETSQRVVDALLDALGIQAGSQGTMNNLIFGDESFGYYETICGGAGAGDGYAGASALHTHMTNTAITDPEILEVRYPVRLERFSIRKGSGGSGRWSGGDGIVRELTFLRPITVSLLTQHRTIGPSGMKGGGDGATGRQTIDGDPIDGTVTVEVDAGQVLRIETPGGGGWGDLI